MITTDTEALARQKSEAIADLRERDAQRGGQEHEALGYILREDDERVARGEPSQVHWLAKDWLEGHRLRRTRDERDARRQADIDAQAVRAQAARTWKAWIAKPENVERLIAVIDILDDPRKVAALAVLVAGELEAEQLRTELKVAM